MALLALLAFPAPEQRSRNVPFLHIPSLDGLRAVSFLIVFAAHAGLNTIVPGGFGVTVFFYLSGFLITTLIRVEQQAHPAGDLGHVGRPVAVRAEVLRDLLDQNVVPVLAPISLGPDGVYNVNADEAAGAVAAALGDAEVVFVTNVAGVLVGGMVAPQLVRAEIAALIADGTISGGMIPKVRAALTALAAGVRAARITNLAGLGQGAGTVIVG